MKRIALILVFAIVMLYIQVPTFSQTEKYGVEADALFQLGIADREVFYEPEKLIKRADFALLAAALKGYHGNGVESSPFIDIDKKYYAAGSIAYLKNERILNGYEDGTFRGEKTITYIEATTVLINMLGYKEIAGFEGEGKTGYIKTARKIGLLDGVYADENVPITQKDAFRLIYNAMEIPVARVQLSGSTMQYSYDQNGETSMSVWLGLNKERNVVKTIGNAAVTWDETGSRIMTVGNKQLFLSGGNYYYGLGKYCDVYYYNGSTDRENEVAAVVVLDSQNDIIEIDTDDVIGFTGGILSYQSGISSTRNIRITASDDISLNGEPVTATQREAALTSSDGKIIINRISGSDINMVVMIEAYDTYFVTAIDKEEMIVYGKYSKKLELEDYTSLIIYDELSNQTTFEGIEKGDVLTVKKGADVCEIRISKTKTETKIVGIDITEKNIKLGNTEYQLTKDMLADISSFFLNDTVTAYIDVFGRIAYMETAANNFEYAYLYDLRENRRESGELYARLYTIGGELVKYSTAVKLRIDGERVKDIDISNDTASDNVFFKLYRGTNNNGYKQLVRYSLDSDEKINNIDTVYKGSSETKSSLHIMYQGYNDDNTQKYAKHGEALGKGSTGLRSPLIWKPDGKNLGGLVLYDSSVVKMMTAPASYDGNTDYFSNVKASMTDGYEYLYNAYGSRENQIMPDILLSYIDNIAGGDMSGIMLADEYFGIVLDTYTHLNEYNEIESVIKIDTKEGVKTLVTHESFDNMIPPYDSSVTVEGTSGLYQQCVSGTYAGAKYNIKKGDFLQIYVDNLEHVTFARMMSEKTGIRVMNSNEEGSFHNDRFIYGKIGQNDGNCFRFLLGGNYSIDNTRIFNVGSPKVYKVKSNKIEEISVNSIIDGKSDLSYANKVFMHIYKGLPRIVVVYSN